MEEDQKIRTHSMTDADLLHLLQDCYTPAGPNIVAAGLVRSARLTPDPDAPGACIPDLPKRFIAHITLHAIEVASPSGDASDSANAQLSARIENRLLGLPSISRVEFTLLPALFPIL